MKAIKVCAYKGETTYKVGTRTVTTARRQSGHYPARVQRWTDVHVDGVLFTRGGLEEAVAAIAAGKI